MGQEEIVLVFSPRRNNSQSGFTLIEIMVVLVILAVVTSGVVGSGLNLSSRQIRQESQQLYQALAYYNRASLIDEVPYGAVITDEQIDIMRWHDKAWQDYDQPISLNNIAIISQRVDNDIQTDSLDAPNIIFFADGGYTPFTLNVGDRDNNALYLIEGDGSQPIAFTDARSR